MKPNEEQKTVLNDESLEQVTGGTAEEITKDNPQIVGSTNNSENIWIIGKAK